MASEMELNLCEEKIAKAVEMLGNGGIDEGHHKQWVIDQTLRILLGDIYKLWVKSYCKGEDGPETYEWDIGIAP